LSQVASAPARVEVEVAAENYLLTGLESEEENRPHETVIIKTVLKENRQEIRIKRN
jgi:hypothetical protein